MSEILNRKRYTQFKKKAQGSGIYEIHAERDEQKHRVRLVYWGKDRNSRMVSSEWVIDRQEGESVEEAVQAFYALVEKDFSVSKPESDAAPKTGT